ncbi:MAG: protein kinase [Candidatus Sericytochromatia bacterium]
MKESILIINKTVIKNLERLLIKNNFIVYPAEKETIANNILSYANISVIIYKVQPHEVIESCDFIIQTKRHYPFIQIIIVAQTGELNTALKFIKSGAYDYFREPAEKEELIPVIKKAILEKRELEFKAISDKKNWEYLKTISKEFENVKFELDYLKRDIMTKNLELEIKYGLKNYIPLKKQENNKELRIGKYIVLEEIGKGGMSSVYKAIDLSLKRVVAIKELTIIYGSLPQDIKDDVIKRFKKEAEIIARLKHENIVRIFDVFNEKNRHYIVMDHLDGINLAKYVIEEKKLPILEIIHIVAELCLAVEYIHENKIIHRDIKPSNIMFTKDRRVKLMDFGVIRDKNISTLTPTGSILGTISYTAPEQSTQETDYRSDIFSIGTILYELITGFNPFESKTYADTFLKITSFVPDMPSRYNYECSDALDKLVMKSLEKKPEKRFNSAKEFYEELIAFNKNYLDNI